MNIIPNEKKLTSSIIFINLASLFTDYCKENCDQNVLYYKRENDVITISMDAEAIMDIVVTDSDVRINQLAAHEDLYQSSRKFIHNLVN
ncbi:hypothetical protein SAMN06265348_10458 [Pedobacter westerhofensis]|uniref:Uncharacterized protein n=1 Tax=Pedobacter westerhofensis TaxID=425512 RepID=A0A521CM72_9SPHI|nr:hypothetical protein [Pedobacter westerhofensis]SMO60542.1 hypothetical protein SAMN06265348_10458 [Pedobacter westerhofensis]